MEQWAEQDHVREQAQHWVEEANVQQNAEIQTQDNQHAANGKQVLTEAAEPSSSGMKPDISDLAGIQVTMMLEQLFRLYPSCFRWNSDNGYTRSTTEGS
jgi:hypothetical protein